MIWRVGKAQWRSKARIGSVVRVVAKITVDCWHCATTVRSRIPRAEKNKIKLINKRHGSRILKLTASRPNHTSYRKVWTNEFVANVLHDNMGSKKNSASNLKKDVFLKKNQIGISPSKFLIWESKFSCLPQKCELELCVSNGSKVLNHLCFLLFLKEAALL